MKWFLLSARDSDKFALYRNSSLLSTASSLIFSRPCLCCHATDRKPPSVRFVKMQWILPLPKLTLCQGKFVETELMENPLTLSSLALPFASYISRAWFFIRKVKAHGRGQRAGEDETVSALPAAGEGPYHICTPARWDTLSRDPSGSCEIGARVSGEN